MDKLGAVLIAEVGSLLTRVTLVDTVDGESRVVGRAEALTTVEPPYENAFYGVLEAVDQIAQVTGRVLLHEGQLMMPQTSERDGVNHLLVLTSAAGEMRLVVAAIARDISANSAIQAAHSTYTTLLQVITLDDATGSAVGSETSWIEQQVQALLSMSPDAVLITGGLEGGAVDAVNRLAHIVGLTAQRVVVDTSGQQQRDTVARPVVYAGNSGARDRVIEALSGKAEIFVVDNVRPALDRVRLEGARQELGRLYERLVLPNLPGMAGIRRLSRRPVSTVCAAEGLMARMLAERTGRAVLLLDAGAASSSAFLAAPGRYHPAVLGSVGTSYGLSGLLAGGGLARIARWLPFPITDADLTHRLLNRMLRPQLLPASRDDLFIELAVAREAMAAAYGALRAEVPEPTIETLVVAGGVAAHAGHPALALLAALDIVEPRADHGALLDVYLDSLGVLPACGALAGFSTEGATTVFLRDFLPTSALARCVVPLGEGRPGEVAVEVTLRQVGGGVVQRAVRFGEIVSLPLPLGTRGQATLKPAAGVRLGPNPPGAEVQTDLDAVEGSALGLVIDARGRPLQLPEAAPARRRLLWEWMVALGAERGPSPYPDVAAGADMLVAVPGSLAAAATPEAAPAPNKRGLFGRRQEQAPAAPKPARAEKPKKEKVEKPKKERRGKEKGAPAEAPPVVATSEVQPPSGEVATGGGGGKRISLADLAAQEAAKKPDPAQPAPNSLESDLAKLRQTVEAPKKRGLFGRKD